MRRGRIRETFEGIGVALFVSLVLGCSAWGEPTTSQNTSDKAPTFEAFRILIERNIFDASRKPLVGASSDTDALMPPSQTLRLMGTWIEGDHRVALFEGMPEQTHQTLEEGGEVAGYHIERIRADAVVLSVASGNTELRVGACLAKGQDGAWKVSDDTTDSAQPATPAAGTAESGTISSGANQDTTTNNTDANGPVKKLLKRIRKGLGS